MENIIEFQGNKYKLIEEGIYEATGSFVLDNEDWVYGDHPDMVMAVKAVNGKPVPWLLAISWKYEDRLLELAYANSVDKIEITTRENSNWKDVGGLF